MNGLLNCSMSLVFTFLCATNQARALTFERAFDLHKNLVRRNKAKKKDLTVNKPKEDKDQTFESVVE